MRNQLELQDLHGSLERSKGKARTSYRPKESLGNLVEGSDDSLEIDWLLSIFLYIPISSVLFQVLSRWGDDRELYYHSGVSTRSVL